MDKFDQFIAHHPKEIIARKELITATMDGIVRLQRIRAYTRIAKIIFMLAGVVFAIQWLQNDLLYLLQLPLNKFTFIKSQGGLYIQALIESLPKSQLLTLTILGILWISWKYIETLSSVTRIKRREMTMKIINTTPRLVIASTVLFLFAVGISGYSYAQKVEQKKLELLREHINQLGRKEFATNQVLGPCGKDGQNLTNQYEIKKGVVLSTADATNIISAYCNSSVAEKFLTHVFPNQMNTKQESNTTTIVFRIVEKNNTRIIAVQPDASYDPKPAIQEFSISADTKVYKNNEPASLDDVTKDSIVMFAMQYTYGTEPGGDPIKRKTLGIYVLPADPLFKWYSLTLQNSVTQIQTCTGNPLDRCNFTGAIDLFPSGGGEGNTRNPLFIPQPNEIDKEIAGALTEIGSQAVKLKTSSGRVFTINFASDPVEAFNSKRSQYYENKSIKLGDTLLVRYFETANQHATTIQTSQIFNAVLMIEVINKTDPIKKY
jgi:hypothetical protein